MRHNKKKRVLCASAAVFILIGAVFAVYVSDFYHATDEAALAMTTLADDDSIVIWETGRDIVFEPQNATKGFIFYPGGKVEARAYTPLMRQLSERGILCVLMKMPCNLAVLDINAADDILGQFPKVEAWYIGGHSLGGSMAASYAADNHEELRGLVMLAAYSTQDLRESGLQVVSLYGSNDGILNQEKYAEYRTNLPADAAEIIIEGGNHAGFGSYGEQEGDGKAYIEREEQVAQTASAICELIEVEH